MCILSKAFNRQGMNMKVTLKEILLDAQKKRYAIPAFNYSDLWELLAIMQAARLENAPVICQSHSIVVDTFSVDWLGGLGKAIESRSDIPAFNHLDHSSSVTLCKQAIDQGYSSVMYDGSALPLAENIKNTKHVVVYASEKNICVEGEVGRITGISDEGQNSIEHLATVEEAVHMVSQTNIDSLAVGIGNQHGFYKGEPKLDFTLLKDIHNAVKVPLVLHGGTGIPDADIQHAIENGICKVNVGTQLHSAYVIALKNQLRDGEPEANVIKLMKPVADAVTESARKVIRLCMADNKA